MGLNPFEPEETVGELWHRIISAGTGIPAFPDEAVSFETLHKRLGIFFRGLGGEFGIELKAIKPETSRHRLKWRERLAHVDASILRARIDGDSLFLPETIEALPDSNLNTDLYFWLTAWAAAARSDLPQIHDDPLRTDIAYLRHAAMVTKRTLSEFPGMAPRYKRLKSALLKLRKPRDLPDSENWLESCIIAMLGGPAPKGPAAEMLDAILSPARSLEQWSAPAQYKPHMAVILWGESVPQPPRVEAEKREYDSEDSGPSEETDSEKTHKASRKNADQADRRDSLLLNPFSGLQQLMEMLNLNRQVEDDEEDTAKNAADSMDEITLTNTTKKAATKLSFNLNLSPEDIEIERLSGKHVYPEWDYRKGVYNEDFCNVLTSVGAEAEDGQEWKPDAESRRRIRAVKRQFEALRPKREIFRAQLDGPEFDMDALIRSRCDFLAHGEGSDRIYLQAREQGRDLAVAVLIDVSRSTESWIEGRQVIEVAREALAALTLGLTASGDEFAIYSFSSLKNKRIFLSTIKDFDEHSGPRILSRIGALKPGFYTRLGAALRHVSQELEKRPNEKRLILVITDGKPNDLDHYEGRYGVEDTKKAIKEARYAGNMVYGVTIDAKAQSYFPYIFGNGAFSIISHAGKLTQALPYLYQHLVA